MANKELTPEEELNLYPSLHGEKEWYYKKDVLLFAKEYAVKVVEKIDTFEFEKGMLSKEEQLLFIKLLKKGVIIKPLLKQ